MDRIEIRDKETNELKGVIIDGILHVYKDGKLIKKEEKEQEYEEGSK